MSDDVYVRMCRESPVQKDWKPHTGDVTFNPLTEWGVGIMSAYDTRKESLEDIKNRDVWLPRQEDWQDILYSDKKKHDCFNTKFFNFYDECTNTITSQSLKEFFTILWCLFVHKEVYGLTWDWEEDRWVKE